MPVCFERSALSLSSPTPAAGAQHCVPMTSSRHVIVVGIHFVGYKLCPSPMHPMQVPRHHTEESPPAASPDSAGQWIPDNSSAAKPKSHRLPLLHADIQVLFS